MASFPINSFKYALDTRRDVLTSLPGTLVTCENCHINPGGEVEKRKAFAQYASVLILDDGGDVGTFGIEVTSAGIVVFGSALSFGTVSTQGQAVLVAAMPAGVTYQQLKHPTLYQDETYNRVYHRITQIVFSENFNGKAFVAAKFADGNTFLYYNGTLIPQSANGLVLDIVSLGFQSLSLSQQLDAINWLGSDSNLDEAGAIQSGSTLVKSPESDYFTPIATENSASGRIGIKNIAQDGAPTSGTKAVAGFQITVNSGTFKLEAPVSSAAATPIIELCGGAIAALGTATLTCAAIAQAVNDLTSSHGYTALSLNASVFIYAPASFGNFTFNLTVTVTSGTAAAAGAAPTALSGVILPSPLEVTMPISKSRTTTVKGDAKIEASGGTAPYTFLWAEVSTGSGNGITVTQASAVTAASNASASFSKAILPNTFVRGNFKCTITDAAVATKVVFLTVNLQSTYVSG